MFQSVAALFVSVPLGSRHNDRATVLLSATLTGSAVPSTRLTIAGRPVAVTIVIEPSYESASMSLPAVVSTSAAPSGGPFWMLSDASANWSEMAPAAGITVDVP